MKQIKKGNPVMIGIPGHYEVIYDYEKVKGKVRYKIHDPGYQNDKYMDPKKLKPYRTKGSKKIYSRDCTRAFWPRGRKLKEIRYYDHKNKK